MIILYQNQIKIAMSHNIYRLKRAVYRISMASWGKLTCVVLQVVRANFFLVSVTVNIHT